MVVRELQLRAYHTADAPAICPVQPLAHHSQPIVALFAIKGKVLHSGRNPSAPLGSSCCWRWDLGSHPEPARRERISSTENIGSGKGVCIQNYSSWIQNVSVLHICRVFISSKKPTILLKYQDCRWCTHKPSLGSALPVHPCLFITV